jgi:hypothetical protein
LRARTGAGEAIPDVLGEHDAPSPTRRRDRRSAQHHEVDPALPPFGPAGHAE